MATVGVGQRIYGGYIEEEEATAFSVARDCRPITSLMTFADQYTIGIVASPRSKEEDCVRAAVRLESISHVPVALNIWRTAALTIQSEARESSGCRHL